MYDRIKNNETARVVAVIVALIVGAGVVRDLVWGEPVVSFLMTYSLPQFRSAHSVAAVWLGVQVARKTKSNIVGWIAGILSLFLLLFAAEQLEGVGFAQLAYGGAR